MPGPAPGDREEEREGRERGFPGGSVMNPPANGEDADWTPVPGRSPAQSLALLSTHALPRKRSI